MQRIAVAGRFQYGDHATGGEPRARTLVARASYAACGVCWSPRSDKEGFVVLHRHLNHQGVTLAAIDDVIERGTMDDWLEMARALRTNPALLGKVRRICNARLSANDPEVDEQNYRFWSNYVAKQSSPDRVEAKLHEEFPALFRLHGEPKKLAGDRLAFGIYTDDGWLSLIRETAAQLTARIEQAGFDVYCQLVKEKFGTIHFEIDGPDAWTAFRDNAMREILAEATARSRTICECCGAPGALHAWKTRNGGYGGRIKTLCTYCASLNENQGMMPTPPGWPNTER